MPALPAELWLAILECLESRELFIAGQVCHTWHKWAFDIRWRARPIRLQEVLFLLKSLKSPAEKGLRKFNIFVPTSHKPSKLTPTIFFDIAAKITTIVIDAGIDKGTIQLLEGVAASSPSKVLFPALRTLEYTARPGAADVNKVIAGSPLKKIAVIMDVPYHANAIDPSPIYDTFRCHPGLEAVDAWGDTHELGESLTIPWPLRLRYLNYSAIWTLRYWRDLVERCVDLRYAKIGCDHADDRHYTGLCAEEKTQEMITAHNIRVLDLTGIHNARRFLPILMKTAMPELRELSFKLGQDALDNDGTEDEVEEAMRVLSGKSPKVEALKVETTIPVEIDSLSKLSCLETLHISNQGNGTWPWVYWDEDIDALARALPRLAHLSLPCLTEREPGTTMLALESLAVHSGRLQTLAIGIDATDPQTIDDTATPFGDMLTSMTFSPLRIPTEAAEVFARNLSTRMPKVEKFRGRVMGLDEGGRAFYWDDGLKIIGDTIGGFRNGGMAELW